MILGVGIEPGTPPEHLAEAVAALGEVVIDVVATLDRRAHEPAILALGRPVLAYGVAELDAVTVPNPSAVVRRLTGTASVAEAAALLAAGPHGRLVVEKQRGHGVTVALAARAHEAASSRAATTVSGASRIRL